MAKRLRSQIQRGARNAVSGRRGGRAIRRVMDRPEYDGDNDGFITNPLTGRDEIPWNRATETAEEAIRKFFGGKIPDSVGRTIGELEGSGQTRRRSGRSVTRIDRTPMSQERRLRNMGTILDAGRPASMRPLAQTGSTPPKKRTASAQSAIERLSALLFTFDPRGGAGQIRQYPHRDWAWWDQRLKKANAQITQKHGDLKTLSDFKTAMSQYTNVKFAGYVEDLPEEDRQYLRGILFGMMFAPEHFKSNKSLTLERIKSSGGAAADTDIRGVSRNLHDDHFRRKTNVPKTLRGTELVIRQFNDLLESNGDHQPRVLMDGVVTQATLARVLDMRTGQPPDPTNDAALDAIVDEIVGLNSFLTGMHEIGHGIHGTRGLADVFPPREISTQRAEYVIKQTRSKMDKELREFHAVRASWHAMEPLMILARAEKAAKDYRNANPSSASSTRNGLDFAAHMRSLETPGSPDWIQWDNAYQNLHHIYALHGPSADVILTSTHPAVVKIRNIMLAGSMMDIQKLAMKDPGAMMAFYNEVYLKPRGSGIQQFLANIDEETMDKMAFVAVRLGNAWDGLTEDEQQTLRSMWGKFSQYAKDKHSWYEGSMFGRPSMEGVAESGVIWMLSGGQIDGLSPSTTDEEKRVWAKMMTWLFDFSGVLK